MRSLLLKLWNDDVGSVLAVEWTLLVGVMVMGVSAGAVAVRDAVNANMANVANAVQNMTPQVNYNGWRNSSAVVAGFRTPEFVAVPVTIQQITPNVTIQQWNLLPPAP